jgi:hypothetical protein
MSEATTVDGVDYGPLAPLIGTWKGDKGMDVAPEPDGDENNPYYETIVFEAAGDVTNAEQQKLAVVRYHQEVRRQSNDKVFHDQVGYWTWDSGDDTVVECFTIPRSVAVVAGGRASTPQSLTERVVLEVAAKEDDPDYGVVQAPFMASHARTLGFQHHLEVEGDVLRYHEHTYLKIYDKDHYDHSDRNTLQREV